LIAPATEAALAAASESLGATLTELAAPAAPAKEQRIVRLPLNAGGRHRLGRRVCRKARRQLELGPQGRRRLVSSYRCDLFASRVGDDVELLKSPPP
jgi:predicted secreted protein